MAITVVQDLDNPIAYIKNVVAYHLNSSTGKECRARIFIEKVPESDNFEFLYEIKAFPNSDGDAYIYLGEELEQDILSYDKPSIIDDVTEATEVIKRIKAEFYEYSDDDLEFIDEAYQISSSSEVINIYALENGENYIIIAEAESISAAPEFTLDGGSAKSATLLYNLGDEIWYSLAASADYNEVVAEKGVKIIIYKGSAPSLEDSAANRSVLLGGRSAMSYGYLSVITPKLTEISYDGNETFNLEADIDSILDHNLTTKAALGADNTFYEAQYSLDKGQWEEAWNNRFANQINTDTIISGFNQDGVNKIEFRIRAYTYKDSKKIRVGLWESFYITFNKELTFGGNRLVFGGKTLKFK